MLGGVLVKIVRVKNKTLSLPFYNMRTALCPTYTWFSQRRVMGYISTSTNPLAQFKTMLSGIKESLVNTDIAYNYPMLSIAQFVNLHLDVRTLTENGFNNALNALTQTQRPKRAIRTQLGGQYVRIFMFYPLGLDDTFHALAEPSMPKNRDIIMDHAEQQHTGQDYYANHTRS